MDVWDEMAGWMFSDKDGLASKRALFAQRTTYK